MCRSGGSHAPHPPHGVIYARWDKQSDHIQRHGISAAFVSSALTDGLGHFTRLNAYNSPPRAQVGYSQGAQASSQRTITTMYFNRHISIGACNLNWPRPSTEQTHALRWFVAFSNLSAIYLPPPPSFSPFECSYPCRYPVNTNASVRTSTHTC